MGTGARVDAAIAVLLAVLAQVQVPGDTPVWVRLGLLVATLGVAARRVQPLGATALVAVGVGSMVFSHDPPSVFGEYLAVLLMAFTVAERTALPPALAGGLLLGLGVVAHDWQSPQFSGVAGAVSDLAIPVVVWGLGRVVRIQRGRAEDSDRRAGELTRRAVEEERAHLARELHDVVTHSLSMVVIQAQGGQRILGDGREDVHDVLTTIETGARGALTDMRRLLGLLAPDGQAPELAPQPALAELSALVDRVRATGQPVTLALEGDVARVGGGVGLSACRIVQESLTNCLKYAAGAPIRVRVRCADTCLDLLVEDDGPGAAIPDGAGRGLVGMRERVALYGGTFEAGPRAGGGFGVHAVLPLEAS